MTLLKDLIDIPEHIDKGQFVLRLTKGVTDPEATVTAYALTLDCEGPQRYARHLRGSLRSSRTGIRSRRKANEE